MSLDDFAEDYRLLVLWAAHCAEHGLPRFEEEHPEDDRPRTTIEAGLRGRAARSRRGRGSRRRVCRPRRRRIARVAVQTPTEAFAARGVPRPGRGVSPCQRVPGACIGELRSMRLVRRAPPAGHRCPRPVTWCGVTQKTRCWPFYAEYIGLDVLENLARGVPAVERVLKRTYHSRCSRAERWVACNLRLSGGGSVSDARCNLV